MARFVRGKRSDNQRSRLVGHEAAATSPRYDRPDRTNYRQLLVTLPMFALCAFGITGNGCSNDADSSARPETTIVSGPPANSRSSTATFVYSATTAATFSCSVDEGILFDCQSPTTITVTTAGPHKFKVFAIDSKGLADKSPAVWTWDVANIAVRPSFIVLYTDDEDITSLPYLTNVNKHLVSEGTLFENAFVTYPVCCPSRATLLTGQYPHNHQVLSNVLPIGGSKRFYENRGDRATIATAMKSAGYRTAYFGKYLNGFGRRDATYVPPGWTDWYANVTKRSAYFDFDISINGVPAFFDSSNETENYRTDIETEQVIDVIEDASGQDVPFLLYISPFAPHQPFIPAPRHASMFAEVTAPRPPSFNEADISDKYSGFSDEPPLSESEIAAIDEVYRNRLRTLMAVDEMVDRIFQKLDTEGLTDNTYVFYLSDNGFFLGQHRIRTGKKHVPWGKNNAYEESIRIPMVIRGPNINRGAVVRHIALNNDIVPTILELADVDPAVEIDGKSLLPLLGNAIPAENEWRTGFLTEHWIRSPDGPIPSGTAYRTTNGKYIWRKTGEEEFYDLRDDPFELENIVSSVEKKLLEFYRAQFDALLSCVGADCRELETATIPGH